MSSFISVILPTYNPDLNRLWKTLAGLQQQTLPTQDWELIIVDNNSSNPLSVSLDWHPNYKVITESKQGLSYARMKGFELATGDLIVMVDDDNILQADYLENVRLHFQLYRRLGATGGISAPLFEATPPKWLKEFHNSLALRDLGEQTLFMNWNGNYPAAAPIGAGMGIRKEALHAYLSRMNSRTQMITDRTAHSLSSGGDNDIILEILKAGWQISYHPKLKLSHIIPEQRTTAKYLARLLNNTNKSWIELLEMHGINPWSKISRWTLPLRKVKAWFAYGAYMSKTNYIKWQGACGHYDGLAK